MLQLQKQIKFTVYFKEECVLVDQKTLAYINLYAVLGTLENLCELDPAASALLTNKKPISIGFEVKDGPSATLTFKNGKFLFYQSPRRVFHADHGFFKP